MLEHFALLTRSTLEHCDTMMSNCRFHEITQAQFQKGKSEGKFEGRDLESSKRILEGIQIEFEGNSNFSKFQIDEIEARLKINNTLSFDKLKCARVSCRFEL